MAGSSDRAARSSEQRPSALKERHALLQRVLWSRPIKRSGRIRDFLQYVCDRALEDPEEGVHEQEIGHRVFGRPADYDTAADNVVRVTASQARKKLEQYFSSDGVAEPVILEIPKGQYVPVFRERAVAAETASAVPLQHADSSRRAIVAMGIALLAMTVLAIWLAVGWRAERRARHSELAASPALTALWSQLIPERGQTDIVVPDSSLSLFQELLDRPLSLAEYLNSKEWPLPAAVSSNAPLSAFARLAAQRGFTSMASVTFAHRIGELAAGEGRHISLFRARDISMRQMKGDNVVLVGSSRANPWEELLQDRLNFRFGFDQAARYSYFTNAHPREGEQPIYRTDSGVSYCRIAFLPNLTGAGNILAIAGTEIEGTEAGGEFITRERSVQQIREMAGSGAAMRLPYFEALLRSRRVGGATPEPSIVAFRRIQP